jgi:hypothetical protein
MLEPIPLAVVCMGEAEKGHTCQAHRRRCGQIYLHFDALFTLL